MRQLLLLMSLVSLDAESLRRLDGSRLSVEDASRLIRETLLTHHVTGAQIAVVNNGKLVLSHAHGLRQRNPDLPLTTNTAMWAASITKGLFGAYVVQQKFPLDTPVVQLLPKPLNQYPAYEKSAVDVVRDPRFATITARMLLSHTAGFHNFAAMEPDQRMRIHFTPGSRYSYSGEGLNLLQFVMEQREGAPLDQLMQRALFAPLGLTRTALVYRPDSAVDIADRFDDKEQFIAKTRRFPARAAGSATTTAEDLARFAIALMRGRVADLKTLLRPVIAILTPTQFPLSLNQPPPPLPAHPDLAYGLGWGLLTRTRFGPAFFKEGHGDGAQNFMICFQKSKSCLILLTNSDNGERTFRTLSQQLLGNTVTPWKWHGYE